MQTIIKLLEVHIGCFNIQRALNDLIHSLNNGRLTRQILEMLDEFRVIHVKRAKRIKLTLVFGLYISLQRGVNIRCEAQTQFDLFACRQM